MSNVALLALLLGASAIVSPGESAAATAACDVASESGAPPSPADRMNALEACATARERFADLFGDPVPGVKVIFWEESRYRMGLLGGEAAIFWPSSEAMTPRTSDRAAAEQHVAAQWREVLPHEISHLLLAVRFFSDAAATPAGGYGTPLPDWLDEAVAIWAEPEESRRRRVDQARELPAELRDLRSILTMSHPAAGRSAAYTSRDGTARQAEYTLWAFYPQSIAVLTFVYEHGGTAATMELIERLRNNPGEPVALAGLPGLPADFAGVDATWKEWLAGGTTAP